MKACFMMIRPAVTQIANSSALPGVIYGFQRYTEYQRGTLNVILSCPHDGSIEPANIPDRIEGYVVEEENHFSHHQYKHCIPVQQVEKFPLRFCKELYTKELTLDLADELQSLTGKRPHIVICHLHRNKLDTNRAVGEATFGVPDAICAYNDYHKFISQAKKDIPGPGLFIDIHGHKHAEGWIELGYVLAKSALNSGELLPEESSISSLSKRKVSNQHPVSFKDLINGESSFGALLQKEGYRVVPSPEFPFPGSGKYYRGGYITRTHGSLYGGLIDAIQIETPTYLCDGEQRVIYVKALARSVKTFMEMHY